MRSILGAPVILTGAAQQVVARPRRQSPRVPQGPTHYTMRATTLPSPAALAAPRSAHLRIPP